MLYVMTGTYMRKKGLITLDMTDDVEAAKSRRHGLIVANTDLVMTTEVDGTDQEVDKLLNSQLSLLDAYISCYCRE